jgi:hypothetical protein
MGHGGHECPPCEGSFVAQALQMQALRWAGAGTRESNSALKSTCVHQHGGCATPVSRAISLAHALGWPHKGQRVGSAAENSGGMRAV